MAHPDWQAAEDGLFERSREVIGQFAREHPGERFSLFALTVDSLYTGVALNFDTVENSLREARRHERNRVRYLNDLFARESGWRDARRHVAHPTKQVAAWNKHGSYQYDLIAFVELPVWEDCFESHGEAAEEEESAELDGRIIASLWRVVERLIAAGAFDGLRQASPFHVAFGFHDDEMIALRILYGPGAEEGNPT